MNRRRFLDTGAATALLAGQSNTLAALAKDNAYRKNIGIQLYTLRNEITKDLAGTMKAVKDAGYAQGEGYGFPQTGDMVVAARDAGLKMDSSHFDWETVVNPKDAAMSDFQKIIEKAKKVGLGHLVIPYLHDKDRKTLGDYKRVADHCNKAAALSKKAGVQLAYHNHAFEFEPKEKGWRGYDIFMKEFSADMQFEIDVFWVVVGNLDPVALMKKLKGRVSQLHLKDLKKDTKLPSYAGVDKEAFKELGAGMIAMEPIINAAKEVGVVHCHVEQDHSPHPIKSIQQSIEYLRLM